MLLLKKFLIVLLIVEQCYFILVEAQNITGLNPSAIPAVSFQTIRVFGEQLTPTLLIGFTRSPLNCTQVEWADFLFNITQNDTTALATVSLTQGKYYLCSSLPPNNEYFHQGTESWLTLTVQETSSHQPLIPIWALVLVMIGLLCGSGYLSGLNLGLMGLQTNTLLIILRSGSPKARKYAEAVYPIRKQGNFLLCSILIGNQLFNNTLAILLESVTSGIISIICSTAAVVVFAEIVPQAICSRHGLKITAKTIYIIKTFMLITSPVSYPLGKLLNLLVGKEIGTIYQRAELKELLELTAADIHLERDEINIMQGALDYASKTVKTVMTPFEKVFMLDADSVINSHLALSITHSGFSRFPVFEGRRDNIVGILHVKDLTFIDLSARIPVRVVMKFFHRYVHRIFDDTKLNNVMDEFKKGHCHMAIVQSVNSMGPGDPFYEVVGIITLEDIIEEIFQVEILDESDVTKQPDSLEQFSIQQRNFLDRTTFSLQEIDFSKMDPQMCFATLSFLTNDFDIFSTTFFTFSVLKKLIQQSYFEFHFDAEVHRRKQSVTNIKESFESERILFTNAKVLDRFYLILHGTVNVIVGKEEFRFERGAFSYFGVPALSGISYETLCASGIPPNVASKFVENSLRPPNCDSSFLYVPDFSLTYSTDIKLLEITTCAFMSAMRASAVELAFHSNEVLNNSPTNLETSSSQVLQKTENEMSPVSSSQPKS